MKYLLLLAADLVVAFEGSHVEAKMQIEVVLAVLVVSILMLVPLEDLECLELLVHLEYVLMV